MRIVFIGSVKFSADMLQQLVEMNEHIVGVCTKKESIFNADHVDLRSISERNEIPWTYSNDINSGASLSWIRKLNPDVIFCFGWSEIIKDELLGIPALGVVGFHPTALPKNRGRHPLIWSLVLGLKETASTFFFMDSGVDSGDIISQVEIRIGHEDNANDLYRKVTEAAKKQILEFVPKLALGAIVRRKQNNALANVWRKRGITDGLIDWRMSAESIHNLVRGLSKPYGGAHLIVKGSEIKVWKTTIWTDAPANIEPGKILFITKAGPVVKCGTGAICLTQTELGFKPTEGDYL
jgi:methionyl-tRNA formyltransferase